MNSRISESKQASQQIKKLMTGSSYDLNDKNTVVVANFSTSLEYHESIALLFENRLFGAGTALLRAQFESYVKGLWFQYCGTDTQVEHAYNDSFSKEFKKLISDLEGVKADGWEDIKKIKDNYWGVMNGYTHSAQPQLARRFKADKITPNYDKGLLTSVLNLSDFIAVRTVIEFSSISNQGIPDNQLHELLDSNKTIAEMFKFEEGL